MSIIYNKIAFIGLGLIAGSMAWATKRARSANEIRGYARSEASRDMTRKLGFCDVVCDTATEAVADAVENEGDTAADEAAIAEQTAEGGETNEQADDTAGEDASEDKAEG